MSSPLRGPVRALAGLALAASLGLAPALAAQAAPSAPALARGAQVAIPEVDLAQRPTLVRAPRTLVGSPRRDAVEARVLTLTNRARARARTCGGVRMGRARPLVWNRTLARVAHEHSRDMAVHGYFSHTGRDGSSPADRMERAGYRFRAAGENIAAGVSLASAASVVRAWLASPAHCRVLMSPAVRELGVGRVVGAGPYWVYWTQEFGARR